MSHLRLRLRLCVSYRGVPVREPNLLLAPPTETRLMMRSGAPETPGHMISSQADEGSLNTIWAILSELAEQ